MKIEKLSIQEEEVMRAVFGNWAGVISRPLSTNYHRLHHLYTTVASVVGNLKRKGYVIAQRKGNGFEYVPAVKEKDYKRHFVSGFVRDYFKTRSVKWYRSCARRKDIARRAERHHRRDRKRQQLMLELSFIACFLVSQISF